MTIEEIAALVKDIQDLLISPFGVNEAELMDVAGRHEEFVAETSEWMLAVDKLLQKGLRTEAIELAERDPNLNEVIIALDFPELDAWNELLLKNDMQPVSELPEGVAEDLNDAYGVSSSLEKLMQQHRGAALARAPLSTRLQILRLLENKDRANPAWAQDIRDFEKARLTEVRAELDDAIKTADVSTLTQLEREFQDPAWKTPVPAELKRRAGDASTALQKQSSLREMQAIAYQISDAFADFNLQQATPLYKRFNALNMIVSLQPSDKVFDIAGPALDWVRAELRKAEQDLHFRNSAALLEAGIDQGAAANELERLAHEATRFDHILPEKLERRLHDRLETLRLAAERRRKSITLATVSASVLAVAVVGYSIYSFRIRTELQRHKTQLAALMEEAATSGIMEPLDQYFELLSRERRSIAESAVVTGLRQQYESLRLQQDGRRRQLEATLATASEAIASATVPSAFEGAFQMLKDAEALALNDLEKSAVLKAESEGFRRKEEVQASVDTAFQLQIRDVSQRVAQLPVDETGPYDAILAELASLLQTPEVSRGLITTLSTLERKVQGDRSEVVGRLEIARALQVISVALGNDVNFGKALEAFAAKYPGTTRATSFTHVAERERDLLTGALKWNAVRRQFLNVNPATLEPAAARAILEEYSQFLKSSGPYPGPVDIAKRLPVLQAIGTRTSPVDGMKTIFSGRAITNAYLIATADGRQQYYADSPPIVTESLTFDIYTTPDGDQTVNKKLFRSQVREEQLVGDVSIPARWLSPQTKLARAVIELAGENTANDFESLIRNVAQKVLREEEGLDPILRMLLVERTLEYGARGSFFIESQLSQIKISFAEAGVPRLTNWLSVSDETQKLRITAKDFLQKHEQPILQALETALSERDLYSSLPIGPQVRWVGWLSRDDKSTNMWQVRSKPGSPGDTEGELVVFGRNTSGAPPKQTSIGRMDSSGTITMATIPEEMLEGRPVFLLVTTEQSP